MLQMNRIEARNGKLYLMPDNTEISKNSVLGIKYLIKEDEGLLKQAQKEVEDNEKMCAFLRQKAIQGTATANESLAIQDRILAESILKRNRIETEIEDLKFSLEIAEEKAKNGRPQKKDDLSEEYEIFSVSKIKAKFDLGNGSVQHVMHTTEDSYDLENANIYYKETGEIVKRGTRIDYNTDFLLKLNRLYILDVKPFLNHHLTNSNNRQKFFDYVKYAALNTEIIKHEGKKTAIQDWVNSVELSLNSVRKTNTESNQPKVKPKTQNITLSELITHKNNVEIIDGVKIQYKNIKGKRLKLLFLALQDLNLLPKERIAQKFYDCCNKEFNWDIASYNAMNGYHFNDVIDNEEYNCMKEYLLTLI
jgi:hypothetical protein